jgi:hypothetical protein
VAELERPSQRAVQARGCRPQRRCGGSSTSMVCFFDRRFQAGPVAQSRKRGTEPRALYMAPKVVALTPRRRWGMLLKHAPPIGAGTLDVVYSESDVTFTRGQCLLAVLRIGRLSTRLDVLSALRGVALRLAQFRVHRRSSASLMAVAPSPDIAGEPRSPRLQSMRNPVRRRTAARPVRSDRAGT